MEYTEEDGQWTTGHEELTDGGAEWNKNQSM